MPPEPCHRLLSPFRNKRSVDTLQGRSVCPDRNPSGNVGHKAGAVARQGKIAPGLFEFGRAALSMQDCIKACPGMPFWFNSERNAQTTIRKNRVAERWGRWDNPASVHPFCIHGADKMKPMYNYHQAAEDYERIEQAIRYLEKHHQRQPTLQEVAESIHLSEYHFQRLFTRWASAPSAFSSS